MTDGPPEPAIIFPGRPTVFYVATCRDCGDSHSRPVPRIFASVTRRDHWADGHAKTGHHIDVAVEIRPDPAYYTTRPGGTTPP